jgi:hypothetical protein
LNKSVHNVGMPVLDSPEYGWPEIAVHGVADGRGQQFDDSLQASHTPTAGDKVHQLRVLLILHIKRCPVPDEPVQACQRAVARADAQRREAGGVDRLELVKQGRLLGHEKLQQASRGVRGSKMEQRLVPVNQKAKRVLLRVVKEHPDTAEMPSLVSP